MQTSETSGTAATVDRTGGVDEARQAVRRETEDARSRASAAVNEVRSEAANAGATLSGMVSDQAEASKDDAAKSLRDFSSAIRRAADDLGERDASVSARFAQEAARSLERLSTSLQARSVSDMARSVADFGRTNPTAFLTGCALAGVAIGRVLVASGERSNDDRPVRDDWSGDASPRTAADPFDGGAGVGMAQTTAAQEPFAAPVSADPLATPSSGGLATPAAEPVRPGAGISGVGGVVGSSSINPGVRNGDV